MIKTLSQPPQAHLQIPSQNPLLIPPKLNTPTYLYLRPSAVPRDPSHNLMALVALTVIPNTKVTRPCKRTPPPPPHRPPTPPNTPPPQPPPPAPSPPSLAPTLASTHSFRPPRPNLRLALPLGSSHMIHPLSL